MKPIINFFLSIFKIIGYLILTVILYSTFDGLYNGSNSEKEAKELQQIEVQSVSKDLEETEAVQLL